jgi:hypothetical protein
MFQFAAAILIFEAKDKEDFKTKSKKHKTKMKKIICYHSTT